MTTDKITGSARNEKPCVYSSWTKTVKQTGQMLWIECGKRPKMHPNNKFVFYHIHGPGPLFRRGRRCEGHPERGKARQDQRLAVPLPDMAGHSVLRQESPPHFYNQIPLKDLTNTLDTLLLASGMFSPPYYKVIVTK